MAFMYAIRVLRRAGSPPEAAANSFRPTMVSGMRRTV